MNFTDTGTEHRTQKYVNAGAGEPVHVPPDTVHVDPTDGDPDTDGTTVFTGNADTIGVVLTAPANENPSELVPAT